MHTYAQFDPATDQALNIDAIRELQHEAQQVSPSLAVDIFNMHVPRSRTWIKKHVGFLLSDLDLLVKTITYIDETGDLATGIRRKR